jgi:hypothetical protein
VSLRYIFLPTFLWCVGLKRCENEGKLMMANLHNQKAKLDVIADDEAVDGGIRDVGRKVMDVESKLRELQRSLRKDIRKKDLLFCEENGIVGAKTPFSAAASRAGTTQNSRASSPRKVGGGGGALSRLQTPSSSRPVTASKRPALPPPSTKKRATKLMSEEERLERQRKIYVALSTPVYIPLSDDEASVVVQRHWRRYKIQITVSLLYCRTVITK